MFAASKSGSADAKDANFKNVTMLLHGNGTNGAQNNTFVDSSTNNFTITRNGNTTQGTFSPYGSNWSNSFDGSSAKLTISSSASMSLDAQFTIECWVYWNGTSLYYQNFIGSNNTFTSNASFFRVWGSSSPANPNKIGIGNPTHDGTSSVYSTNNLVANTWNHVAATRDSSNIIRVFINGSLEKTGSTDTSLYDFGQGGTCIGDSPWDGAQGWYSGYISNLRVIKGTCLYTSSFTPSTTPLTAVSGTSLLTCQSNRFIDNSSNAFAMTVGGSPSVQRFSPFSPTSAYTTSVIGGSGYFDGTGDDLRIATNTAFAIGTGDFTFEAWINPPSWPSGAPFFVCTGTGGLWIGKNGSNFVVRAYGVADQLQYSTLPITNAWTHVVAVRSGTTLSLFYNGTRVATTTNVFSFTQQSAAIGSDGEPTSPTYYTGYISNLRLVKGTAVYDPTASTLTVPTAPLTAISGTSLLLSTANAGIFDNAEMNDLETVGNAQISTSVKKYGSGSISMTSSGDYCKGVQPSNVHDINGGDFTIEFWVNFTSLAADRALISKYGNSAETAGGLGYVLQWVQSSSVLRLVLGVGGGSDALYTWSWSPSTSTWYHVAVTRSGISGRAFINGTQIGSTSTLSTSDVASPNTILVGKTHTVAQYLLGYMDDVRITKGLARYTANFTAPSSAFPDKG